MRVALFALFFVGANFLLSGCTVEYDCYAKLKVLYVSVSNIDSVHFYLNGERACSEYSVLDEDGGCKKCKKMRGCLDTTFMCRTSSSTSPDYQVSRSDCLSGLPIWNEIGCSVDELQVKDLDSSKWVLHVYSNGSLEIVEPVMAFSIGRHYIVMNEQDTTLWYGSPVSAYGSFDQSQFAPQAKCSGGFCVLKQAKLWDEVCYDRY